MKVIKKSQHKDMRDGFSLVEIIIVIAIMAILVGVIAIAVIPNIQRSRESKDLSQLDNIASAANTAIATTKATGVGVLQLGTTGTGVQDVSGYDSLDDPTEAQTLKHVIFQSLPEGAGKTESGSIGTDKYIMFAYDVPNRIIRVAYCEDGTESETAYSELHGIRCKYIDQDFFISNLS